MAGQEIPGTKKQALGDLPVELRLQQQPDSVPYTMGMILPVHFAVLHSAVGLPLLHQPSVGPLRGTLQPLPSVELLPR